MEKPQKIRIEPQRCLGLVWIAAWLFTVGFLHLGFWRAVFAIVLWPLWPYYLGLHFSALTR
jgi:uncharacterized membrane protein